MADIIGAYIGIEASASASIDSEGNLELSISFRIDIIIFAMLDTKEARACESISSYTRNYNEKSKKLIYDSNVKLKSIYDGWKNYVKTYLESLDGKYLGSIKDLEEEVLKIAEIQRKYNGEIQTLVHDIDSKLEKYRSHGIDDEIQEKFIILMSNCIQIIRDMGVMISTPLSQIYIGAHLAPETEAILHKRLKECNNKELKSMINKRTEISGKIEQYNKELSEFTCNMIMIKDAAEKLDINNSFKDKDLEGFVEALTDEAGRTVGMIDELVKKEREMYAEQIKAFEAEKSQLAEKSGFFAAFGKKSREKKIDMYSEEIARLKNSVEKYDDAINATISAKSNYADSVAKLDLNTEERDEAEKIRKEYDEALAQKREIEDKIKEASEEYEILAKKFPTSLILD